MREAHHGDDEHVEHGLLLLDVVVAEPLLQPEARVVDQQVDGPVERRHPLLDDRQLLAVDEVGRQHLGAHAVRRLEISGDRLEPGGVAGHQDEVVAPGRELAGELQADAGRGAGHEGGRHASIEPGACGNSQPGSGMMVGDDFPDPSPTTTLAVANQKGGVAKTTSVASLGAALAELGHSVLLVDLDPQACLTFSLGIDPEDVEMSIHHVLTKGMHASEVVIETDDGVDLLPATIELARAEADLLTRTGREQVLKAALADLPRRRTTTGCCSTARPRSGVLTVAALTAADGVLIPLQCETLSHRGVGQLLDTVHDVRRFTNRDLEVWGVLPTLYDGRTNHARTVLETISETYDLEVIEPPIPKTIKFAEAPAAGRSILATSRSSKGAKAYREAATHLVERAQRPRAKRKGSTS